MNGASEKFLKLLQLTGMLCWFMHLGSPTSCQFVVDNLREGKRTGAVTDGFIDFLLEFCEDCIAYPWSADREHRCPQPTELLIVKAYLSPCGYSPPPDSPEGAHRIRSLKTLRSLLCEILHVGAHNAVPAIFQLNGELLFFVDQEAKKTKVIDDFTEFWNDFLQRQASKNGRRVAELSVSELLAWSQAGGTCYAYACSAAASLVAGSNALFIGSRFILTHLCASYLGPHGAHSGKVGEFLQSVFMDLRPVPCHAGMSAAEKSKLFGQIANFLLERHGMMYCVFGFKNDADWATFGQHFRSAATRTTPLLSSEITGTAGHEGRHAVLLTGIEQRENAGGQKQIVLRFLNSWGSEWGDRGFFTMDFEAYVGACRGMLYSVENLPDQVLSFEDKRTLSIHKNARFWQQRLPKPVETRCTFPLCDVCRHTAPELFSQSTLSTAFVLFLRQAAVEVNGQKRVRVPLSWFYNSMTRCCSEPLAQRFFTIDAPQAMALLKSASPHNGGIGLFQYLIMRRHSSEVVSRNPSQLVTGQGKDKLNSGFLSVPVFQISDVERALYAGGHQPASRNISYSECDNETTLFFSLCEAAFSPQQSLEEAAKCCYCGLASGSLLRCRNLDCPRAFHPICSALFHGPDNAAWCCNVVSS